MKFDLDVPFPESRNVHSRKYNFDEIPVNASFAVPEEQGARLRAAVTGHKKRHPGWDYVTRIRIEDGVRVLRLWRTA